MAKQKVHSITDAPARRPRVVKSSAETTSSRPESRPRTMGNRTGNNRSLRQEYQRYSPVRNGESSASGVGLLEAEFLTAIALLILLMFANSGETYSNRIMSLMKRGTLTCLLFFLLAMTASVGPNAAKFSKAFGALIIVGILVTSPVIQVFTDLDNLIKNDWIGTSETEGGTSASSADTGTGSGTSSSASANQDRLKNAIEGSLTDLSPWLLHVPANALPYVNDIARKILGFLGL